MLCGFFSLDGVEQESEEDIGGEQDECGDDGTQQAAPAAHAVLVVFLFGFLAWTRRGISGLSSLLAGGHRAKWGWGR